MAHPDRLLTTAQAADLLGVTPKAVTNYIRKGLLPASETPGGHFGCCSLVKNRKQEH